ncbi:MAG: LPS export ABC transporter periplasmic protein LptC [Verrucomicrobiota bacterium]|nr:LPS export ABC transporter periplasmic protein LptC [Verrucomicrobiota bacterium]
MCLTSTALVAQMKVDAPVKNFRLPYFNADGFREWDMQGETGQILPNDAVAITSMRVRIFNPKDGKTLQTTITSPQATVHPKSTQAQGKSAIRVEGQNFILTGKDWNWDGKAQKIRVRDDAKVTFNETLDLLLR